MTSAKDTGLRRLAAEVEDLCTGFPEPRALFARLNQILPAVIPADGVCGLMLDPATLMHTGGFHERGVPHSHLPRLLEIEYGERDVNQLPDLARSGAQAAGLWHTTRHRPHDSLRYQDVYKPTGLGDEARMLLRAGTTVWGALVLHRGSDLPPFTAEELSALQIVAPPLARALRRSYLRNDVLSATSEDPDACGLVTLDPGGEIELITATATSWLNQIDDSAGPIGLPHLVHHACTRARSSGEVSLRIRCRTGRWLSLTATRLDAAGRIAVITQPCHPEQLAGILIGAYGLTRREQDVARLAIYGMSDTEIAGRLYMSHHTVRDHIKKIFDKTGTNSRGKLLSLLYFGHYQPAIQDDRPMGTRGWFTTGGPEGPGA